MTLLTIFEKKELTNLDPDLILYGMGSLIKKKEFLKTPRKYGLNLGKNPTARITAYERYGLMPTAVTLGKGSGETNKGRTGYYAPVHIEMLQDIVHLTKEHRYPGVRKLMEKKYRAVFELNDLVEIFKLRFLDGELLEHYLSKTSLIKTQQDKIRKLFSQGAKHREVKTQILDLMCKVKTRPVTQAI